MEINFAHNHADFTNFMQIPDGLLHPVCIINGYILPKLISVGAYPGHPVALIFSAGQQHLLFEEMRRNAIMSKGDEDGRLTAVGLIRTAMGEPGPDGRRRPRPVAGSEFELPADVLIMAFGFQAQAGTIEGAH